MVASIFFIGSVPDYRALHPKALLPDIAILIVHCVIVQREGFAQPNARQLPKVYSSNPCLTMRRNNKLSVDAKTVFGRTSTTVHSR